MAETGQKLECDLVMRGGIASGIVYPRAIAKLSRDLPLSVDQRHFGGGHCGGGHRGWRIGR